MRESTLKRLMLITFCLLAGIVMVWVVEDMLGTGPKGKLAPSSDKAKAPVVSPALDKTNNAPTK